MFSFFFHNLIAITVRLNRKRRKKGKLNEPTPLFSYNSVALTCVFRMIWAAIRWSW